MDEAFVPFSQVLAGLAVGAEWTDDEAGVRTYVRGWEIESPVELDVSRDEEGRLHVGTTPPLYPVRTTVAPTFHRLRFTARLVEAPDAER